MERNSKNFFIIMTVSFTIMCLILELVAISSCIKLYKETKISSDYIEQVIYKNYDDIIQILTDKKLEKANITLDYDDVHVEFFEDGNIEASAYGWNISYGFGNGKLSKNSVKREFSYKYPEAHIIIVILFPIVVAIFLISFISRNRKLEIEKLKEKKENT